MKRSPQHALFVLLAGCLILLGGGRTLAADYFVYFGSHGIGPLDGFSVAHFDSDTGRLTTPQLLTNAAAPAYFVIHPDGKHLYTCNSAPASDISAYSIDPVTSKLTFLNKKPTGGGDPSYDCLDATGRYVMVANYDGGSIAVYALNPDGSLGERTAFIQQVGTSVNRERQSHARAHSIRVDPSNRFVVVADLGADKVFVYRFDARTGKLEPNDPPFATVQPGLGPRHTVFNKTGNRMYLINEMGSNVIRFSWDAEKGVLKELDTVSALPGDFHGTSTSAELLMHPSGKFMYATNRGHDSIAVFSVNSDSGQLTLIQNISTQGKIPRNCELDPTGKWLLVTNHDTNNAAVFSIDAQSGKLTSAGEPVNVRFPFCVRFLAVARQ
jgi:6-phosphogluconolactonase